jgi:hypothetical protein
LEANPTTETKERRAMLPYLQSHGGRVLHDWIGSANNSPDSGAERIDIDSHSKASFHSLRSELYLSRQSSHHNRDAFKHTVVGDGEGID